MTSTFVHGDDRETLSALFDGELQGDAARFAARRLGHDAQWRQACGRWQLCGDVLRGQARAVAAPGFAERVAAAIAAEAVRGAGPALEEAAAASAPALRARPARASRRGWIGGALAASVAMAALFAARPFSEDPVPVADPAQVAAQAPATAQPLPAAPSAPAPQALAAAPAEAAEPAGLTSADASGIAAAGAVAVAELPRRLNERRSRGQSQRAALRASERQAEAPLQLAAAGTGPLPVDGRANPFRPQQSEVPAARPWPRATLPGLSSAGGFTASYGSGYVSPSFYPFEPASAEHGREDAPRTREPVQERPQPQP